MKNFLGDQLFVVHVQWAFGFSWHYYNHNYTNNEATEAGRNHFEMQYISKFNNNQKSIMEFFFTIKVFCRGRSVRIFVNKDFFYSACLVHVGTLVVKEWLSVKSLINFFLLMFLYKIKIN